MSVRRGLAPRRDLLVMMLAYLAGLLAAVYVGRTVHGLHPLIVAGAADLAATVVVFTFSVAYDNSSFYDAYWSVAPLPIALYWTAVGEGADGARVALVLAAIAVWGARLTWNWARGWRGLDHEDWRYVDLRSKTGRAYWLVSFFGLHLMPTFWVFGGLLPVYAAVGAPARPLGVLDGLAALVAAGAIALEAAADAQLHRFRAGTPAPGELLQSGLWAWSRHPNYLGEMGFWWGLWLFGVAAAPGLWWTIAGPLAITLMFRFVSLPMIETRMRERRPAFAEWAGRSSLVLLRPPRRV
jgi:steroid 5-alpha reductase family enzyme